jgi:uncharacterized lipoprotein YajG
MFLGIAAICSGCAFTSATIQIQPPKPAYVASVTGPEKVTVRLQVLDLRLTAGHPVLSRVVSHKINGFGGQGGEISNEEPISSLIERTVKAELEARGFSVVLDGQVPLSIEVKIFEHRFRPGFASGDSEADISIAAVIKDSSGAEVFRDNFAARYQEQVQMAVGSNAQLALELALRDVMKTLASQPALFDALVRAAQSQRPPSS